MEQDYISAHRHCFKNRAELEKSEICGCFYCLKLFSLTEISEWVDDNLTGLCPKCGIDSVIGSASGFRIEIDLLTQMKKHWFG